MENHGTAFPSWYITFQQAAIANLPRPPQIDKDTALGWANNGEELGRVLGSVLLPPVAAKQFIAREKFVVNTSPEAHVKISFIGANFQNWHLSAIEEAASPAELGFFTLETAMFDKDIIAKIGGVSKAIVSLADVYSKMEKQPHEPKSPAGDFLTSGHANISYVPQAVKKLDGNRFSYINTAGHEVPEEVADSQYLFEVGGRWFVLRAVGVRWGGGGWDLGASSVERPGRWSGGSRVFSRKLLGTQAA